MNSMGSSWENLTKQLGLEELKDNSCFLRRLLFKSSPSTHTTDVDSEKQDTFSF